MTSSTVVRVAVLCALGLSLASPARASDWPRFRGPNGEGISHDKDVPVQWSDKDIVFKVAIPGLGHAGPIVSKGRVFIHTATKEGGERALLCIDGVTGKTLWTKTIPAQKHPTHKFNSLASATPAADGERVYCAFWNAKDVTLYAFDFSGKELWKYSFGGFGSQHGAGFSPVVYDGKVFFLHDQDKDKAANVERASVLACLDADSGKLIWEKTREAVRACYSAPFMHENGGKKELILLSTPGITSYSPENGKINWNFDWKFTGQRLRTVASPIMTKGLVVAVSGDGNGARHMIAIKAGGQGNVSATNLVWEYKRKGFTPYVPCPLAKDEYVFCVNDDGFASCVTAKDGKELWRERLDAPVTASPVMIDGKMYVFGEGGDVIVLDASPKFNELARNKLGEPISASPAVADGKLYIRTRSSLICIGKK